MKRLLRVFDAMATGFTVGEKFSEGEALKGLGIGLGLAFPLLAERRVGSLALAVAVAVGSYYFWEKIHGDAVTPSVPSSAQVA